MKCMYALRFVAVDLFLMKACCDLLINGEMCLSKDVFTIFSKINDIELSNAMGR